MRYFSMVFDGGFKLSTSPRELIDVMQKVERVHIVECATPVDAYTHAYNECQWQFGTADIPSYELIGQAPAYYVPNYITPVIDYCRMYAVMHPWYVGIFTDEEMLADVLDKLPFAEVIEALSEEDARAIIGYWYLRQHPMEIATYQRAPICPKLPLDIMMPVATTNWFEYHLRDLYGMPPTLQATATLNLETQRDKELFETIEEHELPETTKVVVYQNGKPIV